MEVLTNRHSRRYAASPDTLRPWLEAAWSGTDRDIFPRDVVPSWRKPAELVPGLSRLGHGPFRFRLRQWDGRHLWLEFPDGEHGFDLDSDGQSTLVTHTLELRSHPVLLALARRFLIPIHDWAVEAILDRLEAALQTGRVPAFTERALEGRALFSWTLANPGRVRNRHSRLFACSREELAGWVDRLWSGTEQDAFPRDRLPTFRKNPDGSGGLIPGVTKLGHGPTRFRLEKWDGHSWEVSVLSRRLRGRHGFVLTPEAGGTRLTHVLELELSGWAWLEWPLLIRPIHDWAVEALFDRLQEALSSGRVSPRTSRPVPFYPRLLFASWGWLRRLGLARRW